MWTILYLVHRTLGDRNCIKLSEKHIIKWIKGEQTVLYFPQLGKKSSTFISFNTFANQLLPDGLFIKIIRNTIRNSNFYINLTNWNHSLIKCEFPISYENDDFDENAYFLSCFVTLNDLNSEKVFFKFSIHTKIFAMHSKNVINICLKLLNYLTSLKTWEVERKIELSG